MGIDFFKLYKKILEYWNKHDGEDFTKESLKEFFSVEELACIMLDYNFSNINYPVINRFKDKLLVIEKIFTPEEADKLLPLYQEEHLILSCCSDEFLLTFVDDNEHNKTQEVLRYMKSDETLMKAFAKLKNGYLKAQVLRNVKDTDTKLKYLKKIPASERASVIMSFDDDYLIEKFISLFNGDKGTLIKYLDDDSKKERYLKRYFAVLSKEDRADIITSFKDDEKVLYYLRFVGDYAKGEALNYKYCRNPEMQRKLLSQIKNKRVLGDVLKYGDVGDELIDMYIGQITSQDDLEEIIFKIEDDALKIKYFDRLSYKRKLEMVKEEYHPEMKFKLLKYITKPKDIVSVVEHTERFPVYSEDYEYILDIYANLYKVDKGRLEAFIKNTSMGILKYIENANIQKILNAKEDEFVLLMRIFNKDDLKMNQASMNDILNAMLQREFRLSSPEVILIFPLTLNAIDSKDKATVIKNVETLSKVVNLDVEIEEYGWTKDTFIDALMNKDENAIDFLHVLTAKYIRSERSNYVQERLGNALENSTRTYCDKNDLMRYVINNFPVEFILSFFHISELQVESGKYTQEEFELAQNEELVKQIIKFKKNPSSFDMISQEVKANMKVFNSIFEKSFAKISSYECSDYNGKKNAEFNEVDEEFLTSILMYIDMDKLRVNFLKNPEMIAKFMKFWKQYKIGGWGNTFNSVLSSAGVVVDPEIVANFIQYFGLSYEQLEEKKAKKEISSISLTALLDLAACYSSESKKYSLLFGDEDFKLIASNPGPNSATWAKDKRIERAIELVHTIRNRDYVTVPPIDKDFDLSNGKKMNVVVGNFSNMMNLTYGERTGACMRIGGAGKSLFDFCLQDDNGFHVRFVNPKTGRFVSRVSGFRNGNTIFLNELRFSEDPEFTNKDVVEVCKAVARELIEQSKDSELPIDNVVVTPYYAMKDSGMFAKNIGISDPQKGMKKFYTDVSSTSIILATSAPNGELVPPKLGVSKVPKYPVLRGKKKILYNREAAINAAHINTLDQVLGGVSLEDTNVVINEDVIVCLAGEDWYVTIDKQGKIDRYIMNNSNNKNAAINEVQEALAYLRDNLNLEKEMQIANSVLGV